MKYFQYQGILMNDNEIVEMRGIHQSTSIESAQTELIMCGLKVTEIREANNKDIQIDRLKKFKRAMEPVVIKPRIEPIRTRSFWDKLLFWR